MSETFFGMEGFFTACPNCGKAMVAARVGGRDEVGILSVWICDCNQDAIGEEYGAEITTAIRTVRAGNRKGKGITLGSIAEIA